MLRYDSYRTSGGVRGAVARLAEAAYTQLDEAERRIARSLMLRLAGDQEGVLVRRRVPYAELVRQDGAEPVVAALIDARLLTVTDGEVELSHEALLREWPRYRTWLDEDRAGRRLHAHLTSSAREWDARGRDAGDLYRGARLSGTLEWAAQHEHELSFSERRFLEASRRQAARATRRLYAILWQSVATSAMSSVIGYLKLVGQVLRDCRCGDEAVDGLVGVVLKQRVGQVGEEVCLVDHGTFERVGRAGVEHAAGQGRVGDAVDESLRAHIKFVGETQGRHHVFGPYTHRQWEVTGCLGAGGVAGAHGDEA
ncbi:MAG TPA: hypothetical protein VMJ65_15665, partial [Solirubrobacteraceae bacterium]|nr:hypothetical protein [Solirubrobacteraceae bacterium]